MLKKLKEFEKKTDEMPAGSMNSWAGFILGFLIFITVVGLFTMAVKFEMAENITYSAVFLIIVRIFTKKKESKIRQILSKDEKAAERLIDWFFWTFFGMTVLANILIYLNKS